MISTAFLAISHAFLLGILVVSLAYKLLPVGNTSEYEGSADKPGSTYPPSSAVNIDAHSLLSLIPSIMLYTSVMS